MREREVVTDEGDGYVRLKCSYIAGVFTKQALKVVIVPSGKSRIPFSAPKCYSLFSALSDLLYLTNLVCEDQTPS